jgi:selenide,water dikinase
VTLVFETDQLPFLTGALELARQGIVSGGSARNRLAVMEDCDFGVNIAPELVSTVLDAETSGGLLIAVGAGGEGEERLVEELGKRGVLTRKVGTVEAGGRMAVRLT